jgi:hypothetical protein
LEHLEALIAVRVYDIINTILVVFPSLSSVKLYEEFDLDKAIHFRRIRSKVSLPKRYSVTISEKYLYRNYKLVILYNYSFLNAKGEFVFTYDNSSHYPDLANFPHHKHFHPKDKYPPVSFSGELIDALREIMWMIERES